VIHHVARRQRGPDNIEVWVEPESVDFKPIDLDR